MNSFYEDLEIICVNDGSFDHSIDILMDYQNKDSRVKVINQKNAGVSNARNTGLINSHGDYLVFCDADDWVSPDFFNIILQAGEKKDVTICNVYHVDGQIHTFQKHAFGSMLLNSNDIVRQKIINALITHNDSSAFLLQNVWGKIYKRSIIEQFNLLFEDKISYAEDWLFNIAFFLKADTVCFIEDALYYHRINLYNSLSKSVSPYEFNNSVRIQDLLYGWFPEKELEKSKNLRILEVQCECLIKYLNLAGIKGYSDFCESLYSNNRLKSAYLETNPLPFKYKLPGACLRKQTLVRRIGYRCWCYNFIMKVIPKKYIKKLLA